nr:hypothetical protein [Streptomyces tsukubensis NRRL18488]
MVGTACWVRVRAAAGVSPVRPGQCGQRRTDPSQIAVEQFQGPPGDEHRRRVQDVLTGGGRVDVPGGLRIGGGDEFREPGHEEHHRIGGLPPPPRQRHRVLAS